MSSPPWEAEFPGRLEHELACLEAAGIRYDVDDEAGRLGVLQLRVSAIGERPVDLRVTFPDLYPFVRPSVRLAVDQLEPMAHHAHPFTGDLCLIGRSTALWHTDDTLAWLLTTQLPKTLQAGQITATSAEEVDALAGMEDAQAEPWTDYYSCFDEGSMILVDSSWTLPTTCTEGVLGLRLLRLDPACVDTPHSAGLLHGAVFTVNDGSGQLLCSLSGQNPDRFPRQVTGRWARLDVPVRGNTPEAFLSELKRAAPGLLNGAWQPAPVEGGWDMQIFGLTFPEERVHRGNGDGWVFLLRLRQTGGRPQHQARRGRGHRALPPGPARTTTHLIRAGYAGQADMAARVPELAGLHDCHVAVFGVGALGSTVTEHLARAGVGQLSVVDRDHLEPGNLVRHAARLDMAGWGKGFAASQIALSVAPDVIVNVSQYPIGAPRANPEPDHQNEVDAWSDLIDKVNLVVDCTAEKGLQQALAWLARRRGKPYLAVSAANGGWGGRVTRFSSASGTACWYCLEYSLNDESIPPVPAAPDEAGVQPVGCADPTFAGAGFDIAEVALQAVRVAVATLQQRRPGGYPDSGHDVHVLALRTPDGAPLPPTWTGLQLPVHPLCRGNH